MITVSCSKLESVRQNPVAYAQQLLLDKKPGGRKGMLKCWQMKARLLHTGELDLSKAIHGLQQNFMEFAYNKKNKKRQEFLLDCL